MPNFKKRLFLIELRMILWTTKFKGSGVPEMSEHTTGTESAYKGLVCTAVMDMGPEVLYNLSEIDDSTTQMLAIQALTMISMGEGSRGLHGPIPVPHTPGLQAFIYTFFAPALDSEDERVRKHGRQYAFFLIFTQGLHYTDQITAYTADFIKNWIEGQPVTEKTIESLHERLQASVIFTIDTTEMLQDQVASLSKRVRELETTHERIEEIVKRVNPSGADLTERIRNLVEMVESQNGD